MPCFDSAGNFTGYANESPDGNCGCTKICTTGPRTCYFGQTVGTLFGPAAAGGIAAFNAYGCRGSGVIDLCNGVISMNLYNNCPPGGSNTLMGTLDL